MPSSDCMSRFSAKTGNIQMALLLAFYMHTSGNKRLFYPHLTNFSLASSVVHPYRNSNADRRSIYPARYIVSNTTQSSYSLFSNQQRILNRYISNIRIRWDEIKRATTLMRPDDLLNFFYISSFSSKDSTKSNIATASTRSISWFYRSIAGLNSVHLVLGSMMTVSAPVVFSLKH